jgi:hypothetical protein
MAMKPGKLSDMMLEMAQVLLRKPSAVPTSEATHLAQFFANVAWNESIGLGGSREGYRNVWETIELDNPELWNEFKPNDINAMIDELIQYKQEHYGDDRRRILTCGIPDGKIRVEWLPPPAPGIDSHAEMRLFGLVKIGEWEQAIRFLQETEGISRKKAVKRVVEIAAQLGIR